MDEDASLAPAMDVANELPLDVAPSTPQVTLANEKEYLYLPPEGTFICVALQEGVLPPVLMTWQGSFFLDSSRLLVLACFLEQQS